MSASGEGRKRHIFSFFFIFEIIFPRVSGGKRKTKSAVFGHIMFGLTFD